MTIDQYISDFLRDAQYRIAEMGVVMDALRNKDLPEYKEFYGYREELYAFMDIIYVGDWSIIDGYNHLDWDEFDIKAESEYLRNRTGMITSPFTTFVGNYPEIVESLGGQALGSGLPAGFQGQYVGYNGNGVPIAINFPIAAGMIDSDTAQTFFT